MITCSFLNGKFICSRPDEVSDGENIGYHDNGVLYFKYPTRDGFLHGICNMWNEKGALVDRRLYFRGDIVATDARFLRIKSESLTARDIITIQNATIRQFFLEEFGYERFLQQMPHIIIERDGEQELICINWHAGEEPIYLVKVKCPSVGVFYTLRVPPEMNTVKEAIAWTFGLNKIEYKPEIET